jgi:hypothetical protein
VQRIYVICPQGLDGLTPVNPYRLCERDSMKSSDGVPRDEVGQETKEEVITCVFQAAPIPTLTNLLKLLERHKQQYLAQAHSQAQAVSLGRGSWTLPKTCDFGLANRPNRERIISSKPKRRVRRETTAYGGDSGG